MLCELGGLVLGGCAALPGEDGVSFGVLYPALCLCLSPARSQQEGACVLAGAGPQGGEECRKRRVLGWAALSCPFSPR